MIMSQFPVQVEKESVNYCIVGITHLDLSKDWFFIYQTVQNLWMEQIPVLPCKQMQCHQKMLYKGHSGKSWQNDLFGLPNWHLLWSRKQIMIWSDQALVSLIRHPADGKITLMLAHIPHLELNKKIYEFWSFLTFSCPSTFKYGFLENSSK